MPRIKPLGKGQSKRLGRADRMALGTDNAYTAHEEQLRDYIRRGRSGEFLPCDVQDDIAKLHETKVEHKAFRGSLKRQGLL